MKKLRKRENTMVKKRSPHHFLRIKLVLILSFLSLSTAALEITLINTQQVYLSGMPIQLAYSRAKDIDPKSWIGIFKKEESNRRSYLDYQYFGNMASGTLTFTAPKQAGDYWFIAVGPDYDGKEYARVSFSVKIAESDAITLKLNKDSYQPEERIELELITKTQLADKAWVGIFPASVPDQTSNSYLDWKYIAKNPLSTFIFTAPKKPGKYSFRIFDNDQGNQISSVEFVVNNFDYSNFTLSTDKKTYAAQEKISAIFKIKQKLPESAWIGIFEGKSQEGNEWQRYLNYEYINKRTEGEILFTAPSKKGDYHLRLISSENGAMIASSDINVSNSLDSGYLKEKLNNDGKIDLWHLL